MTVEHLDVLIVGAGLSGIAAAYYLQRDCAGKKFAILEGRSASGGTWDLFRYPGIRSDSDMFTFGFSFKPWNGRETIAGAPAILRYLRETARENSIDEKIRFNHRLVTASWDSASARWTVQCERGEGQGPGTLTCNFLLMCTGYYSYSEAYRPQFAGEEDFKGPIVHPQFWPADLDYRGKHVVVIGSGATAVTMVPVMAKEAAHVTMLQRSPSYILSRPGVDTMANWLRDWLPANVGARLARFKYLVLTIFIYTMATRLPSLSKNILIGLVRWKLGPTHDAASHFTPSYQPWDQRMCLVPDGDLFASIRAGKASVATDVIERFTSDGIRLASGKKIAADIVVCATGLKMQLMEGVQLSVDGVPVVLGETIVYQGFMYSGVPNLAAPFGYSNASWTLKAELICAYVCRLLNHMDTAGQDYCVPRADGVAPTGSRMMNLSSGYVSRALPGLPRQGSRSPWKAQHNYARDICLLRYGRLDDGAMRFEKAPPEQSRSGTY